MIERIVTIIGKGDWGSALGAALNNSIVRFVYRDKGEYLNLKHIKESDYVFIAVPTQKNREIFELIAPLLTKKQKIVLCSKGIEIISGKFLSEIASEFFDNDIMVLSGPNFASEIREGLPAITSIACKKLSLAEKICSEISSDLFKLYPTDDILGVEIFGSIKNVVAIACGISIGLKLGENYKAAVITRMIIEIEVLLKNLIEDISSIISPAGIGDIILTCTSEKSRNTSFGKFVVKKPPMKFIEEHTVEGYYTLESIVMIASKKKINLPITNYLYKVCYQNKKIRKAEFIKIINGSK